MKTLGVVLAGVFAGVVIVEIFRTANPDSVKGVEQKATNFVSSIKAAFRDGYQKAV